SASLSFSQLGAVFNHTPFFSCEFSCFSLNAKIKPRYKNVFSSSLSIFNLLQIKSIICFGLEDAKISK
ncbi:MAG: hypothetical protein V7K88_12510, partial [Nostoc sp.]|uniref:hypothetical protein n=1 Tax=Nostoc sp. TaxID=1180 RepID=UPI002FF9DC01